LIKHRGDSITIQAIFTDEDDNAINPDGHEIKIYDPKGALKKTETAPDPIALGQFRVTYRIPDTAELGDWKVIWKAWKGNYYEAERLIFSVYE